MEYLASGKVTVSTYTDEYKDKRDLLEMVDDSKEYVRKFEKVIENLDFYNSDEKQEERITFAKNNSYEKQFEKISRLYLKQYNLQTIKGRENAEKPKVIIFLYNRFFDH